MRLIPASPGTSTKTEACGSSPEVLTWRIGATTQAAPGKLLSEFWLTSGHSYLQKCSREDEATFDGGRKEALHLPYGLAAHPPTERARWISGEGAMSIGESRGL